MYTKVSKLSELSDTLVDKNKIDSGVSNFASRFKVGSLLRSFSALKEQGYSLIVIITNLIFIRLQGTSINGEVKTGNSTIDDNTFYRTLNDPRIDWRKMLLSFALQFTRIVKKETETEENLTRCFVVDDSLLEKSGKTIEGISRVSNHVKRGFTFGFKLLLLGYFDGKMLIPADFSLHRESRKNNFGLKQKEEKKQFKSKNPKGSPGEMRKQELDEKKTDMVVKMIKGAAKKGLNASYVLMDSWFTCEEVIKSIRKIKRGAMHVVGMCKMDKRKFNIDGKELNSAIIVKMHQMRSKIKCSKKYKSQYIVVNAVYKGIPVKLFYVKYKRAKTWTLILSTDTSISFNRAMEIYQIRWTIEVLFKECKQYLNLGKAQNTNFNGQIADTALALTTYTILSLGKRFGSYETIGSLFRANKQDMLERTICERIMEVILSLIMQLLEFVAIDIDQTMRLIAGSNEECEKIAIMLNAVNQHSNKTLRKSKVA